MIRKLHNLLVETMVLVAIAYGLMLVGWVLRGLHAEQTFESRANAARVRYYHARAIYYEDLNAETRRSEHARRPPTGDPQPGEEPNQ